MAIFSGLTVLAVSMAMVDGGWRFVDVTLETAAERYKSYPAVYPYESDDPGPLFHCHRGNLRMTIALERPEVEIFTPVAFNRARAITGRLEVAGEKTYEGEMVLNRELRIVGVTERKPAAQVFNAVVRGDEVVFSYRRGEFKLRLPPVDDDFAAFSTACKALTEEKPPAPTIE